MGRHEWTLIGADCLVLSCCCQFLILQILLFVLIKLPRKVFRRIKAYVKMKFGKHRKEALARCAAVLMGQQRGRSPSTASMESFRLDELDGCIEEVENVLEEMSQMGEFGFGSFWRGVDDNFLDDDVRLCFVNQQLGYYDHDGNYHFIPVFGPLALKLI